MDYDSVDIYDYDSDDIYDDSNANTGTDIFTLDYRHVEINNNDNKVYNLYDNYFNHIDEINIMDNILSFVANEDIKDLINFRCVDTYSRDCVDNFLKFNSNKKSMYIRNTLKNKYNHFIIQENLLNISYLRNIYYKLNISLVTYFKNTDSIKLYSESCDLYDDICLKYIIKFKRRNKNKNIIKRNRLSINKNKWINMCVFLLQKPLINY